MQNAKDSFYMALRTRLADDQSGTNDPAARSGAPGDSGGGGGSSLQSDSRTTYLFCAGWVWASIWTSDPRWRPRSARSSIRLAERRVSADLDRGRSLSEMDEELVAMLAAFLHAKAQLHGDAAGGDVDEGVLG